MGGWAQDTAVSLAVIFSRIIENPLSFRRQEKPCSSAQQCCDPRACSFVHRLDEVTSADGWTAALVLQWLQQCQEKHTGTHHRWEHSCVC